MPTERFTEPNTNDTYTRYWINEKLKDLRGELKDARLHGSSQDKKIIQDQIDVFYTVLEEIDSQPHS